MKKLMMMTIGALALGVVAQGIPEPVAVPEPVPAPVTSIAEASVVTPAPAVTVSTALETEVEPGALCKIYLRPRPKGPVSMRLHTEETCDGAEAFLASSSAVPSAQSYDDKSMTWDGNSIAQKYKYDLVVWDGVFVAKQAGRYVFTIDSYWVYGITVNGKGVKGNDQQTFTVDLAKGPNKFCLWREYHPDRKDVVTNGGRATRFSLEYRLASSTKPAKPVTPSMLSHIVDDEEEW